MLIRGLPEISHALDKNLTLTYAARIYLEAGILDTAYMYAHELAHTRCSNQKTGYQLLLSPELSSMLPPDSLRKYVRGFRTCMEEYLNENESTETLIQNSYYNYNKHLRDKETLERSNERIRHILIITLLLTSLLCVIILYMKYRNARQSLRLRDALDIVTAISSELSELKSENRIKDTTLLLPSSEEDLRQQLLDSINSIEQSGEIPIPDAILTSELYKTLNTLIKKGKVISGSDPIWQNLESLILTHSPRFKDNLMKLTNGKMSKADIQIAILVRFGISPSGMANLLSLSPAAITSRRTNLCIKIFGKNLGVKVIDRIIRLL